MTGSAGSPRRAGCAVVGRRVRFVRFRLPFRSRSSRMRPMQVGAGRRGPSFDEGSLDQYLREISKYPLIPQEEEVTLAQRIRTGEEEALDKLVRSNLRFVVSVAKKYQNQGVS